MARVSVGENMAFGGVVEREGEEDCGEKVREVEEVEEEEAGKEMELRVRS